MPTFAVQGDTFEWRITVLCLWSLLYLMIGCITVAIGEFLEAALIPDGLVALQGLAVLFPSLCVAVLISINLRRFYTRENATGADHRPSLLVMVVAWLFIMLVPTMVRVTHDVQALRPVIASTPTPRIQTSDFQEQNSQTNSGWGR